MHNNKNYLQIKRKNWRGISLSFLIGALGVKLLGTEAEGPVITLDTYVLEASHVDSIGILPERPIQGFGAGFTKLIEIPRSISTIESELMERLSISDVNDFVKVTPGTFTGNYFGVPGALDVRGDRADNLFRGFRRVENRGNYPTPLGATEFVEIIKGPMPVSFGPGKVGGALNFYPRTARSETAQILDEPTGKISFTIGSYEKYKGSAEYGAPIEIGGKAGGYYVYLSGEDSNSFYNNVYQKSLLAQIAFNFDLSDSLRIEFGTMYHYSDLAQNLGWNRVTQDLIDNGTYITGSDTTIVDTNGNGFLDRTELDGNPNGPLEQFAFAQDMTPFVTSAGRPGFFLDTGVGTTRLRHNQVQADPDDFSKTDAIILYFDVVKRIDLDTVFTNQSFFDAYDHQKYSTYGFTADYNTFVIENRSNYQKRWILDPATISGSFGGSVRYSDGTERESRGRGYQVQDRRDLSLGYIPANTRFERAEANGLPTDIPFNHVQKGDYLNLGGFANIVAAFENRITLQGGIRLDYFDVTTNGYSFGPGSGAKRSASDEKISFNTSLSYDAGMGLHPYVTYAKSSYLELGQGSVLDQALIGSGAWLQESEVFEIGLKGSFFDNRLYTALAFYQQERSFNDSNANASVRYESQGFEAEVRWAVNEKLAITGATTFTKTELQNTPFFLGIPPASLGYDLNNPAEIPYGGRFIGNGSQLGLGSPIEWPAPNKTASLYGIYTFDNDISVSFGGTYIGGTQSGFFQQVQLPSYIEYNGSIGYKWNNWSVNLAIMNIFEESGYTPQFLFQEVFIGPNINKRTYELSVSYSW
jgi:iron complex outermembrane receptor protein